MSMTSTELIRERLADVFKDAQTLDVVALDAACGKYAVTIVSDAFVGQPVLKRHRMVNDVFQKELLDGSIHALEIHAKAPVAAPPVA